MTTATAPAIDCGVQLDWWSTIDVLDSVDENEAAETVGSAVAGILRQLAELIDNPRTLSVIARNEIVRKALATAEVVEGWAIDHKCEGRCDERHCDDGECRTDCDNADDHIDECSRCEDRNKGVCEESHCTDGFCRDKYDEPECEEVESHLAHCTQHNSECEVCI